MKRIHNEAQCLQVFIKHCASHHSLGGLETMSFPSQISGAARQPVALGLYLFASHLAQSCHSVVLIHTAVKRRVTALVFVGGRAFYSLFLPIVSGGALQQKLTPTIASIRMLKASLL